MKASALFVLFLIILESCNTMENKPSTMPTSPNGSVSVTAEKGKGAGKDSVSVIKPNLPPPGGGGIGYQAGSQYVANDWLFEYLPRDGQGKYLMLEGGSSFASIGGYDLATLHDKYCFRRAVVGDAEVPAYTNARFNKSQLLISIGSQGMNGNWTGDVSNPQFVNGQVLGFWVDEPSGCITSSQMASIKSTTNQNGGKLWLDDYDTSPIPSNQNFGGPHDYHQADFTMLQNSDYVCCDGNNSYWVNGENVFGDNVLAIDYVEFQGSFGNKFNTIWCMPTDVGGALRNDDLMNQWLTNYPNLDNFALYLGPGIHGVDDNNVSAREAAISNFMNDAYNAGFLGYQYRRYNYTYVCQKNSVNFTPPNCPVPPAGNNVGAGNPVYWGVWTNNSYYNGPVDASTPGATICWILQSTAPTSEVTDVHP